MLYNPVVIPSMVVDLITGIVSTTTSPRCPGLILLNGLINYHPSYES